MALSAPSLRQAKGARASIIFVAALVGVLVVLALLVWLAAQRAVDRIDGATAEREELAISLILKRLQEESEIRLREALRTAGAVSGIAMPETMSSFQLEAYFGTDVSIAVDQKGDIKATTARLVTDRKLFTATPVVRFRRAFARRALADECMSSLGIAYGQLVLITGCGVGKNTGGVITVQELQRRDLEDQVRSRGISQFSILKLEIKPQPGARTIDLVDVDGTVMAVAAWMPSHGAATLVSSLLTWTAAAGGVFLFSLLMLSWWLYREFRKARDLAVENEAMRAASRSKDQFIASMSHELRTPLNAIIGFSDIMRQEMFGPLNNRKYADYATDIHSSASHLLDIIQSILTISRLEAGKLDLALTPVRAETATAEAVRILKPLAAEKGLVLRSEIAPDCTILGNETALKQILVNLGGNAVKFTDAGSVDIRVARDANDDIVITVADTGPGMTTEALRRLGEAFYQEGNAYVRGKGGTGLGISITKGLVAAMHGHIDVESRLGAGTIVSVRLPGVDGHVMPFPRRAAVG